jgi:LysR family glycine cleavage system transcriptional activator
MSIKLAAEELNVTAGAVSQQVAKLEEILGMPLFARTSRRMELTEAGKTYLRAVSPALRHIEQATQRITQQQAKIVTVSCTPGFAMQWLLPRLPQFQAIHPDIDVRINTTNKLVDLLVDEVDFAVRHGLGAYAGLQAERMIDDHLYPVCSPALLPACSSLLSPTELPGFALLHDEHRDDWRLWLRAMGIDIDPSTGPVFVASKGAIDAAVAGLGVALARKSLIRDELASGKLVMAFPNAAEAPIAYHLVYDSTVLLHQHCQRFRKWILAEAEVEILSC